jgi:peptide/nickel transport system ATP-binding protein
MRFGGVVEAGPTAAILNRPVDPYTRSLVKAVPSLAGALAESRRVAQAASSKPIPPTKNGLAVKSLVAFYGDHQVLHGIDLAFAAGECTAIVGESGSGKTTLCRSLIGLHSRYSGTVTLNGATLDPHARRRTISQRRELQYVFQNPYDSLNPRKTVRDLILQPMVFLREPVAPDFVARQLDRVSLGSGMADRFPHQLSGGERQRVALARALAVQPRVLICDEVTSALDVSVQASVIELIGRLRRELGLTIIFVTHYLALVPQIAQRVAVVRAGRIVDVGPTSAVFDSPGSAYTRELLEKTLDLPQVEIS